MPEPEPLLNLRGDLTGFALFLIAGYLRVLLKVVLTSHIQVACLLTNERHQLVAGLGADLRRFNNAGSQRANGSLYQTSHAQLSTSSSDTTSSSYWSSSSYLLISLLFEDLLSTPGCRN